MNATSETFTIDREGPGILALVEAIRVLLARFPISVLQLAMRIGVGMVFFNAGLLKIQSWEFTILLFRDEYKVPFLDPEIAARMATFNELTFPVFLFLGLMTRLVTLPMLGMILVIQTFVYPGAWADHLLWGSILLFILTRGPGVFSLDFVLDRWFAGKTRK